MPRGIIYEFGFFFRPNYGKLPELGDDHPRSFRAKPAGGRQRGIPEAVDLPKRKAGEAVPDRRLVQDARLRDPSPAEHVQPLRMTKEKTTLGHSERSRLEAGSEESLMRSAAPGGRWEKRCPTAALSRMLAPGILRRAEHVQPLRMTKRRKNTVIPSEAGPRPAARNP